MKAVKREVESARSLETRRTDLGWLASFVVSEAVATHNNNFEVEEWASKFVQTLSNAIGKERLTFLEFG